jgi:hypothetical protein
MTLIHTWWASSLGTMNASKFNFLISCRSNSKRSVVLTLLEKRKLVCHRLTFENQLTQFGPRPSQTILWFTLLVSIMFSKKISISWQFTFINKVVLSPDKIVEVLNLIKVDQGSRTQILQGHSKTQKQVSEDCIFVLNETISYMFW